MMKRIKIVKVVDEGYRRIYHVLCGMDTFVELRGIVEGFYDRLDVTEDQAKENLRRLGFPGEWEWGRDVMVLHTPSGVREATSDVN